MIIRQTNTNEVFGLQNQTQFSIKASPMAFRILSDGLYSDKIKSIIRELSCNAYDSHVAAGTTDIPFKVQLPVSFDPFFSIRDYGTGLSEEDICSLYTTYFESTKSNSNDFVGALGLGSKSPFSYVDSFTVDSYFDGVKKSYCIFIGESGFPTISKLFEEQSEEHSGLKITLEVKSEDFQTWKQKAELLSEFNPSPECNLDVQRKFEVEQYDGYQFRSNNSGERLNDSIFVKQGTVLYPLDLTKFEKRDNFPEPINKSKYWIIECPIGTVSFTASRESISYDDATVEFIKSKLDQITSETIQRFETQFKDILSSMPKLNAYCELYKHKDQKFTQWFFRNVYIEDKITAYDSMNANIEINELNDFPKFSALISKYDHKRSLSIDNDPYKLPVKKPCKILVKDVKTPRTVIISYLEKHDICLLSVDTMEEAQEFVDLNYCYQDDIITVSSIKPPKQPRGSYIRTPRIDDVKCTISTYHFDTDKDRLIFSENLKLTKSEVKDIKGWYITLEDYKTYFKKYSEKRHLFHMALSEFTKNEDFKICIVNKQVQSLKHSLTPLKDVLIKNITKIESALSEAKLFNSVGFDDFSKTLSEIISLSPKVKNLLSKRYKEQIKILSYKDRFELKNNFRGVLNLVRNFTGLQVTLTDIDNSNLTKLNDELILLNDVKYYRVSSTLNDLELYIITKLRSLKGKVQ